MAAGDYRRTEPNARDRQTARTEGRVALSREMVFALTLPIVLLGFWWQAAKLMHTFKQITRQALQLEEARNVDQAVTALQQLILQFAATVTPILGAICLAVVIAHWIQHGPLWVPTRILPDAARIQPSRGWQRLQQRGILATLAIGGLRSALLIAVMLGGTWSAREMIFALPGQPVDQLLPICCQLVFRLAAGMAVVWLGVAALDFAYQLWRHEQALRDGLPDESEVKPLQNDLSGRRR